MRPIFLSKSKYINGLQCLKYLWILFHEPERIPEVDAATQYVLDQGRLVGELAKKLFPGGIDLSSNDFTDNIKKTRELIKLRKPIFEAGIMVENIYCRPDILNPSGEDSWDIIEVKSSSRVKEVHIDDVSFQRLCCEKAGLRVGKCYLMHINSDYVKQGEVDPEGLFRCEDITDLVTDRGAGIMDRIDAMCEVISRESCPEVGIGPYCNSPYDCPLYNACRDGLPEHNIFTLYYGGKKAYDLFSSGVFDIIDIPDGYRLNQKQMIQLNCVRSGDCYLDKEAINRFLLTLEYPLHFLDFETFSTAIPLYDGTRPYQNIPFQFSLHVISSLNGEAKHYEFLADGDGNPRLKLLAKLREFIGDSGSIIAYNKSFEERVLLELSQAYPEYTGWVDGFTSRLVDLLVPFRSFHYYHPMQKGSASLKSVLPAITGKGYDGLAIAKGDDASLAYLRLAFDKLLPSEVEKMRLDLLKYCKLDTEGMIWILDELRGLST